MFNWLRRKKVYKDRCNTCGNVFLEWSIKTCGFDVKHTILCHQYHNPPDCTDCCTCNCFNY